MSASSLIFAPLVPWIVLYSAAALAVLVLGFGLWRGLRGWMLRAGAAAAILAALSGPSMQVEERAPLGDYLLAIVDESASQTLSDRGAQTQAALEDLEAQAARTEGLELRVTRLGDGADNRGTLVATALREAMAEVPSERIAGVVVISDGVAHDAELLPEMPAPAHLLRSGRAEDWDRRLSILNAPAFAILDEEQVISLRIDDMGAAPSGAGAGQDVALSIAVDGNEPQSFMVPVGRDLSLPVTLTHGGANVIQFATPAATGELTDRNNTAVVSMNGVRDRLRVLLVTGVPHPGTRTWRNLLKSDSAVDLVHFTILRPPEKQDGVPVSELSLIAFPTQELFLDKIDEFDLIIFDRYKMRGILPSSYLASVRDYVRGGGAVLVAAGPDLASAQSLARSPLGEVLPGTPTARVIEEGYRPEVTDLGARHPVTRGLEGFAPEAGWGRWMRLIELEEQSGMKVLSGADDLPLLMLDRVEEGRVALLASDHAWMWSRGFEGGGPQLELLKRLAHWMMKEPELEEEALSAAALGGEVTITRRSMDRAAREVTVADPAGGEVTLALRETEPGVFEGRFETDEIGLFRIADGARSTVVAVGPAAAREFDAPLATGAMLAPIIGQTRGGDVAIEAGIPSLRAVRAGRVASGRGWIGYTPRAAFVVEDLRVIPLAPAWLMLCVAALFAVGAWLYEGRGRTGGAAAKG